MAAQYGLTLRSHTVHADGFEAEYWKDEIGVRLAYRIRDPFTVEICFPGGVRVSDDPELVLRGIDLLDVVDAVGLPEPLPRADYYPFPDRRTAAALAEALRAAAGPMLGGDRTLLPELVSRIRARMPPTQR